MAYLRLDNSNTSLKLGVPNVTARDVVESQASLLDAQDQYERAKSDLQIQVLLYMRDTGTLRLDQQGGSLAMAMDRAALKLANKTGSPR